MRILSQHTLRRLVMITVTAATAFALEPSPVAQSTINISFPSRLAAGPDYATDVLGDPWDMSNADDVGLDPSEIVGWTNFSVTGGVAGGTTVAVNGAADSYVSFLHRGHYGIVNPGKNGLNFPIDTSTYQKIAFRISDSVGNDHPQVYWFHNAWNDPAAAGDPRDPTGQGLGGGFTDYTATGYKIIVADLTQTGGGIPWTEGVVRGLRLDPNIFRSGQQVFFDWIRLTANDGATGAAMQTISWTGGSGSANIDVIDSGGTVLNIATNVSGSSYNWNYGILPPGQYTLRVTRGGVSSDKAFSINNPPIVHVTDPDETGGEDFATTVLGNAWDMDSSADIVITGSENITNLSFSSGQLHATNTNSDPNITLLSNPNNSVPIDTSKYRYLTYTLQVDGAFDLGLGSVARLFWGSQQFFNGSTATTTKDIIVWPGMRSYTIDLASLSVGNGLESTGAAEAWTSASKRHLRFDPHEFDTARTFHIDGFKLAAMDQSTGAFTIRFVVSEADAGDSPVVTLYYDTDRDSSNGMTQIASSISSAAGQYAWDTTGVTPGVYYIYAVANDGVQNYGRYSTGPIRVLSPVASSDPLMTIDAPVNGATLTQPFLLGGWAIDRGSPSGTGVDAIHVYALPAGGGPGTFLGVANYYIRRDDVGAAFGTQFTNSGYDLTVTGLSPGTYTLAVYAHSSVTNSFNQSRAVTVTIPSSMPAMSFDGPAPGSTIGSSFNVVGWAIDRAAPSGTGVDQVHVYAWPNPGSGQAPVLLGYATYGIARSDIGSVFGSQFTNSGFSLHVGSLAPGVYHIAAYAHSTVAGAFNNEGGADVTVTASTSNPVMSIDGPPSGSTRTQPFTIEGWAIDLGASSGPGVDAIHCWAYPVGGGGPTFVNVGTYGIARPDIGAVYGTQFTNSGFSVSVPAATLPSGTYDMHVYAHSSVTGTFNQERIVRITIP